jgi:DNA-directed RNA polymerase subunit RPC12/RpoP
MDDHTLVEKEIVPSVQCSRCQRRIALGSRHAGDTVSCPFCDAVSLVRERIILVAEPLEQA